MSDLEYSPTHQSASETRDNPQDEIELGRLFAILSAGKWWIAGCLAAMIALAVLYLWVTPYTYSADALIEIQAKENSPLSQLAGQAGGGMGSGAIALLGMPTSTAQSEIPIILSRDVLGQTVNDLNLVTETHPKYLPIIGGAFVDKQSKADVSRFDVPDDLFGKPFELMIVAPQKYKLVGPGGEQVLDGTIGKAASGKTADGKKVELFVRSVKDVSQLPASFTITRKAWLSQVNSLREKLLVEPAENGTSVLTIALEGNDPEKTTEIVNSVAQGYLEQNVEARSEQAAQSLEFLKSQLPRLKSKVTAAESKLAEYQEGNQPVDLSAQAQALLTQVSSLEDKRSQLKLKVAELSQQYTSQYPEVQAARDQLVQLREQSKDLKKNIDKLPNSQKQMLGLQRDVEVNTQLYTALLNRAQELRVAKAGTVGNVRIVDKAVLPVKPVSPRPLLVLVVLVVLGLMIGIAVVLLRVAFRHGVSDPQEIEGKTGLAVYAVVPFSGWLGRATRRATRSGKPAPILVRDKEDSVVAEALRSLRTSLYFAQMEAGSNVLIMTGPSPGVGKSFVSVNLGYLLSQVDQRVVVVDADMRRGRLREYVVSGDDRPQGLSELLAGQVDIDTAIQRIPDTELDVITSGAIPSNPSELLMRSGFKTVMDTLRSRYDLVIVDAPPVLAVTDAAVIGAVVANPLTFMVLKAGHHPMEEINQAVERLSRQHGKLSGFVLNAYQARKAKAYQGYSQYQYAYNQGT